jgi:catechol 2,3-dioxygenase
MTSIPAGLWIGHINLAVTDLERSVRFYRDVLGFNVRFADDSHAFLSAGEYYHHIVLAAAAQSDGSQPVMSSAGLRHFALNYPERRDLASALKRLLDAGWNIDGAADYGTHDAIYLSDPDGIGIELAWDGDPTAWARDGVSFARKPLDFAGLLAELNDPDTDRYLPQLANFT